MDVQTAQFVGKATYLAVVFGLAVLVDRLVSRAMRRAFDVTNVRAASIFVNLVRALVWVVALLSVLQPVFGIDPSGFVAALGVSSVVISFGLQDTVSNVVAGLGLMLGKVVQPGDQVTISGYSGEVVDVTWRNTVVRDRSGAEQVIPNSVLNTSALTRRTRWDVTDCSFKLVVRSDADLDAVEADMLETGARVLGDHADPEVAPSVLFTGVTPLGVEITAHFHVVDSVLPSVEANRIIRALAERPWLAHAQAAAVA